MRCDPLDSSSTDCLIVVDEATHEAVTIGPEHAARWSYLMRVPYEVQALANFLS